MTEQRTADLRRVYQAIDALVYYARGNLELEAANEIWVRNQIFALFDLASYAPTGAIAGSDATAAEVIGEFSSAIVDAGLAEADDVPRLADQVLGILSLDPARLQARFGEVRRSEDATGAMQWLYDYSVANNYVRKAELDNNPRFDVGDLIITINLAKPEFRSAASAKAGNAVAGGYPQCTICHENEGFAGRNKFTLRTAPVTLDGQSWFWQFSPYGYFDQHGIVVNTEHTPMGIDERTFARLMDFVDQYPHYFIGSNAALPRIGGSVLGHDHYQGGRGPLPMQVAKAWRTFDSVDFDDTLIEVLNWHSTAIRVVSKDREAISAISQRINEGWLTFEDRELGIVPRDGDDVFSAISPTVVLTDRGYEMSIILRSNITSEEFPEGIFHAHPEFHAIKQESIGLIEAQGLFILPARLIEELGVLKDLLFAGSDELPSEMAEFVLVFDELRVRVGESRDPDVVDKAIREELGSVCARILENTAVFKDRERTVRFLKDLELV